MGRRLQADRRKNKRKKKREEREKGTIRRRGEI